MSFCWSTLIVKNMEESLKFYQDIVGLNISNQFTTSDGKEIAFLGDGETKIELIYDKYFSDISIGNSISLGFEINSIEGKMKYIGERGIEIESGPFQPNANIKFFYIIDPNGIKIQLVEKISNSCVKADN